MIKSTFSLLLAQVHRIVTSKLTALKKRYGSLKGLHVSMDGIQSAIFKLCGYIRRNHIS